MDLTFVQTSNMFGRDGAWETEFSVDQEFNLHLERESSGKIIMMQKTAGTFFDIVKDFDMKSGDVVYDYDSASFLGTKTIKIVSESAIRFASLTTSGEVTEIKSQSKEIEVTSNGTTEVTPDAGFAYLNSVKVKTNVPTSGGGGGSVSSWKYYDISALDIETKTALSEVAMMGRAPSQGVLTYGCLLLANILDQTDAFSLDINCKILQEDQVIPISVMWKEYESMLLQSGTKEITEEEFYNLNV